MITTNEAWPYPSHPAMHPKEENKVIVATSSKLMNIQNGWLGSRLLVSGKLWTLYVRRQKMWKAELALSRENHRCSRRRSLRLLFVKEAEKENARKVAPPHHLRDTTGMCTVWAPSACTAPDPERDLKISQKRTEIPGADCGPSPRRRQTGLLRLRPRIRWRNSCPFLATKKIMLGSIFGLFTLSFHILVTQKIRIFCFKEVVMIKMHCIAHNGSLSPFICPLFLYSSSCWQAVHWRFWNLLTSKATNLQVQMDLIW